jgi:hypothetical protein
MAAVPPPFDPGDEPDPREAGYREQAAQPAGQEPGRQRRAGYAVVAILLLTLLVVAVLVLVL